MSSAERALIVDRSGLDAARRRILTAGAGRAQLSLSFLDMVPVTGVAISILSSTLGAGTVSSSDRVSASLDGVQLDLGEGPNWQALARRTPALHPAVRSEEGAAWPVFAEALVSRSELRGVEAVFSFPLMVGALDIGAVGLYRTAPGALSAEQVDSVVSLARLASLKVLESAIDDADLLQLDRPRTSARREIHQATGMVLVQLAITAEEAALVVRAHAFVEGRPVIEVAEDIVARRLVFRPDGRD